jgi:hypothetical protein
MAKIKHKKNSKTVVHTKQNAFTLPDSYQHIIYMTIIIIILLFMLKPMVIDGLTPQGVDVMTTLGQSHKVGQYYKETGDHPLWNPYVFGGMPLYHRLNPVTFSLDTLINKLNTIINRTFLFFLLAASGMYLLFRYLNMSPLICLFGTVSFILLPHFKSLYLEGHYAKFMALMFLPWVFLAFKYLLDRKNILSAALFALAFGLQIRTEHYQIVFYTAILLFAVGIYPLLKIFLEKDYKLFTKSVLLISISLIIAIMIAAQPLFLAREYIPYSKRGKTTINLNQPQQLDERSKTAGVSIEYATQWSTHPSEILTWIIPGIYGGMSGERYTGSNMPHLKNQIIPGYWGYMPFTQSYEYMGIILILLAIVGIVQYGRQSMLRSLCILGIFFILLSFGRHFMSFYKLFFNYLPFFNKFRAPFMSVTVTSFILCILGTYGLHYLYTLKRESESFQQYKNLLITIGVFVLLGLVLLLIGPSFEFSKAGENYQPEQMGLIKSIREEILIDDVQRYLLLLIIAAGSILAFLKRKISSVILVLLLISLSIIDLVSIQGRYHKRFSNKERLEKSFFAPTATDKYLLSDKSIYRIYPLGNLFKQSRWSYYHQTIGGYTPVKMYTIEELIYNNLQYPVDNIVPINWNVLQFLNVKYTIIPQMIEHPELTLVHSDSKNKLYTYLFKDKQGLFVISELFYPPGWKIFIDGNEVEKIYKTNHAIQSIIVPEGEHIVELKFAPDSFTSNVRLAGISLMIVYLSIIGSLIMSNKSRLLTMIQKIIRRKK